jgi:hypothetical protein
MIVSFYNIATELSHMKEENESYKIYMEGYQLSQKMLGQKHRLTKLMKSIIK